MGCTTRCFAKMPLAQSKELLNYMKNLFNMDQRSSLSHISMVISSKPALYQFFIYFCNPKTPETSYIADNVPGTYQSQALD